MPGISSLYLQLSSSSILHNGRISSGNFGLVYSRSLLLKVTVVARFTLHALHSLNEEWSCKQLRLVYSHIRGSQSSHPGSKLQLNPCLTLVLECVLYIQQEYWVTSRCFSVNIIKFTRLQSSSENTTIWRVGLVSRNGFWWYLGAFYCPGRYDSCGQLSTLVERGLLIMDRKNAFFTVRKTIMKIKNNHGALKFNLNLGYLRK